MFTIAWPLVFLLLPIPFLIRRLPLIKDGQITTIFAPFLTRNISNLEYKVQTKGLWINFLAWALIIFALSRPQVLGEPIPIKQTGRDIEIAVDTSGSMRQQDMVISNSRVDRLTAVKAVMNQFIDEREGDRMGLILFGDRAYTQAPLTFDRHAVKTLLDESFIGIAGNATAVGDAIGLAVKKTYELSHSDKAASPVLILITDGQSNSGTDPIKAAELAKQVGLKIYTIGVGSDKMVVNSFFGQRTVNPSQDLDEATLKKIAEITDGKYFRAKDTKALLSINETVNKLEPVSRDQQFFRPITEYYYFPLLASILLLFLNFISWRPKN